MRPSVAELREATINGIAEQPIVLRGGQYEGAPFQPGGASRLRVTLAADLVVFGELDGAPGQYAAALLTATAGGSGSDVYVAVFQTRGVQVVNVGTALIGNRVQVRALDIVAGVLTIDVVEVGAGDAMCCPSQLAGKSYAFRDGALTLLSSVVSGTMSLAMLAGTDWTLVSLDGQPLAADARPPTLRFDGTRVSGFGGCNRYVGQVTERTPGAISLGPLAGTKMACPPAAMGVEDRYLASLAQASHYAFSAGRLALSGVTGDRLRQLMFKRAAP